MDLKHVPHTDPVDLRNMVDDEYREMMEFASDMVREALDGELEHCPPINADFPILWAPYGCDGVGGPPVSDSTTIYVGLPLNEYGGDQVIYSTTITEMIREFIEDHEGDEKMIEPAEDMARKFREFSDALEQMAARNRKWREGTGTERESVVRSVVTAPKKP